MTREGLRQTRSTSGERGHANPKEESLRMKRSTHCQDQCQSEMLEPVVRPRAPEVAMARRRGPLSCSASDEPHWPGRAPRKAQPHAPGLGERPSGQPPSSRVRFEAPLPRKATARRRRQTPAAVRTISLARGNYRVSGQVLGRDGDRSWDMPFLVLDGWAHVQDHGSFGSHLFHETRARKRVSFGPLDCECICDLTDFRQAPRGDASK